MLDQFKPLIVDDFYSDPDDVALFAYQQQFRRTKLTGTESLVTYKAPPNLEEQLTSVANLVGVSPDIELVKSKALFWGFAGCGEFQLRLSSLGTGKKHIHVNGGWTGIVYLSKTYPKSQVGTYFYQHLETGISHVDETNPDIRAMLDIDQDDEKWRVHCAPSMRYNRLILFDSRFYHSEPPGFGDSPENGRLIQIFNMGLY